MTILDDKLRPRVLTLVEKLGKDITYTAISRVRNASTGETEETPVNTVVKATPPTRYFRDVVDGDAVRKDDLRVSMAAKDLAVTPEPQDTVTIDSIVFIIVKVQPVFSGELEALWTLQLRRR